MTDQSLRRSDDLLTELAGEGGQVLLSQMSRETVMQIVAIVVLDC